MILRRACLLANDWKIEDPEQIPEVHAQANCFPGRGSVGESRSGLVLANPLMMHTS